MNSDSSKVRDGFLAGFLQGLASPVMLFSTEELHIDRRSDLEKMRSDMLKVRNDFNVSIQKVSQGSAKSAY